MRPCPQIGPDQITPGASTHSAMKEAVDHAQFSAGNGEHRHVYPHLQPVTRPHLKLQTDQQGRGSDIERSAYLGHARLLLTDPRPARTTQLGIANADARAST